MKLSFVIPAYNEEYVIGACLSAIIKEIDRAGVHAEIIVVNNASTDRTRAMAEAYPRVRVVDEPEKGLVKARRRGFVEAQGELVANIDADNLLPSGWITTVLDEFKRNPRLVCLSGPLTYHDLPWRTRLFVKLFYGIGFLFYLLNRFVLDAGSMVQGGNFILKRAALEKVGGFDTRIDFYGEDTDIAKRLHRVGDVKFSFRLPIWSSGRRLAYEGVVTMGLRYALNYIWMTFLGKPFHPTSTDIRKKHTQ